MSSTRSTTGCLACKIKRKKCDETKPHCLRCQKSRMGCPGYTYIEHPNKSNKKLRTLPAPRTRVGQSRATADQSTPLESTQEPGLRPQDHLSLGHDMVPPQALYNLPSTSVVMGVRAPVPSFTGSFQHSLFGFNATPRSTIDAPNLDPISIPPGTSATAPMTSGQASLLEALFSLNQGPNLDPPPQFAQLTNDLLSGSDVVSRCLPLDAKVQDDATKYEDEDLEGVASVICRQPVLDRTAESNALPFVLQSYARWISRLALDPLKVTHIARDFVFSQFGDGYQSRWIIALLANIGNRIGSVEIVEVNPNPMLPALQGAMRQRLAVVKSRPNPEIHELVKTLDSTLEAMLVHFFVSPFSEAMILRYEAAPIFRQLCPGPPDSPINLPWALQHPLTCLRHYAYLDILFSIGADMPTLFRYEVTIPGSQPSNPYQSVPVIQSDGVVQWLHGMPDQLILLFAKINSMQQDGLVPNDETIALIEQEIRETRAFDGTSSGALLSMMRLVVQECWRQTAYVYLYM
ncbi:unnamed protein product, partial [Rhizoctonia solani]